MLILTINRVDLLTTILMNQTTDNLDLVADPKDKQNSNLNISKSKKKEEGEVGLFSHSIS